PQRARLCSARLLDRVGQQEEWVQGRAPREQVFVVGEFQFDGFLLIGGEGGLGVQAELARVEGDRGGRGGGGRGELRQVDVDGSAVGDVREAVAGQLDDQGLARHVAVPLAGILAAQADQERERVVGGVLQDRYQVFGGGLAKLGAAFARRVAHVDDHV